MKQEPVFEKDMKGVKTKPAASHLTNVPLSEGFIRRVIQFRRKEHEAAKLKK